MSVSRPKVDVRFRRVSAVRERSRVSSVNRLPEPSGNLTSAILGAWARASQPRLRCTGGHLSADASARLRRVARHHRCWSVAWPSSLSRSERGSCCRRFWARFSKRTASPAAPRQSSLQGLSTATPSSCRTRARPDRKHRYGRDAAPLAMPLRADDGAGRQGQAGRSDLVWRSCDPPPRSTRPRRLRSTTAAGKGGGPRCRRSTGRRGPGATLDGPQGLMVPLKAWPRTLEV